MSDLTEPDKSLSHDLLYSFGELMCFIAEDKGNEGWLDAVLRWMLKRVTIAFIVVYAIVTMPIWVTGTLFVGTGEKSDA